MFASVLKFDPAQPRDDSGKWTAGLSPAAVLSSVRQLSPAAARRKDQQFKEGMQKLAEKFRAEKARAAAVAERPKTAYPHNQATRKEVVARLKALVPKVSVAVTKKTAVTAASHVAEVLEEMSRQGYALPDSVSVKISRSHRSVHGQVVTRRVREFLAEETTTTRNLTIHLPETLPEDVNLDDAAAIAFGGQEDGHDRFAVRTMNEVIIHEMGHVQAPILGPGITDWAMESFNQHYGQQAGGGALLAAMKSVSNYAASNSDEFMAEAFVKLYRGESLPADAQKLYDLLNGPKVKR